MQHIVNNKTALLTKATISRRKSNISANKVLNL